MRSCVPDAVRYAVQNVVDWNGLFYGRTFTRENEFLHPPSCIASFSLSIFSSVMLKRRGTNMTNHLFYLSGGIVGRGWIRRGLLTPFYDGSSSCISCSERTIDGRDCLVVDGNGLFVDLQKWTLLIIHIRNYETTINKNILILYIKREILDRKCLIRVNLSIAQLALTRDYWC